MKDLFDGVQRHPFTTVWLTTVLYLLYLLAMGWPEW